MKPFCSACACRMAKIRSCLRKLEMLSMSNSRAIDASSLIFFSLRSLRFRPAPVAWYSSPGSTSLPSAASLVSLAGLALRDRCRDMIAPGDAGPPEPALGSTIPDGVLDLGSIGGLPDARDREPESLRGRNVRAGSIQKWRSTRRYEV